MKDKNTTERITRESIIKSLAKRTMISVNIIREFYNELEELIVEHLSSVTEDKGVEIKLFNGITLNGIFVPEHRIRNNNVSDKEIVPSRIKPQFYITKDYLKRLNSF